MPLSLRSLCLKDETNISEYNGILFSHEKERISDTCYNIDEPWGHYAKWSKPFTKRHTVWFHFNEVSWFVKFIETENKMVVAEVWREENMVNYCLMSIEFQFCEI